jgi:hypothetical protein
MHVALDVCHDRILWHLRDAIRVAPTHEAHPPPIVASPLAVPLPVPWKPCASNATSFPAHFETLSSHILSLAHPPDSSIGVMRIHLVIVDLH